MWRSWTRTGRSRSCKAPETTTRGSETEVRGWRSISRVNRGGCNRISSLHTQQREVRFQCVQQFNDWFNAADGGTFTFHLTLCLMDTTTEIFLNSLIIEPGYVQRLLYVGLDAVLFVLTHVACFNQPEYTQIHCSYGADKQEKGKRKLKEKKNTVMARSQMSAGNLNWFNLSETYSTFVRIYFLKPQLF